MRVTRGMIEMAASDGNARLEVILRRTDGLLVMVDDDGRGRRVMVVDARLKGCTVVVIKDLTTPQ